MFQLKQSFVSAFRQLKVDRFRTLLSLLGVSVGVFSVIAVLTVVDSINDAITEGFDAFGSDMVMIEQIPIEPDLNEDGFFKWWKYVAWPQVSIDEYRMLAGNGDGMIDGISFCSYLEGGISYKGETFKDGEIVGLEGDWTMAVSEKLQTGRGFSEMEMTNGQAVTIIGNDVAEKLFATADDAIGKTVKIVGSDAIVIGVFEKMGTSDVSLTDIDAVKAVPYSFSRRLSCPITRNSILTTPVDGIQDDEFEKYLCAQMRNFRRLSSGEENNFSLNKISFVKDEVDGIFSLLEILGWLVGTFSLLIGGFGIANIMFVAVQERVPQIGVMKAIGAPRMVIVCQFLVEAVIISLLGAATGLLMVAICVGAADILTSALFTLSVGHIIIGFNIALVLGVLSGVAPAIKAASLQPSTAIAKIG